MTFAVQQSVKNLLEKLHNRKMDVENKKKIIKLKRNLKNNPVFCLQSRYDDSENLHKRV